MAKTKEKATARELYIYTDKTQAEIAKMLGVSEPTLSNWAKEGGWEQLRTARRSAPAEIQRSLMEQLRIIAERNTAALKDGTYSTGMADEQHKVAKTLEALSEDTPLHIQIQVLEQFMNSVPVTDKAFRSQMAAYQAAYLTQLAKPI